MSKMKRINVNKENYKKYRYLSDYRYGALESLTDEELKAQIYHLRDIYRGTRGVIKTLHTLAKRVVESEMIRRNIK